MVEILKKVLKFIWAFLTVPLKQKSISRDGQKVIIDNSRGLRLGFFIFFYF